jgi:long-chain acyl-CoA synthetase
MFIHQTVARARRLYREREAVVCGDVRLTYAQLDDRVGRLAGALAAAEVGPEDRVGALLLNCHHYLEAYLGTERAGAVLTPLNHRLAAAEMIAILNDAEAAYLLVDTALLPVYEQCRDQLATVRGVLVCGPGAAEAAASAGLTAYEDAIAAASAVEEPARPWQEEDLVQLYYTSGTTGRAKGVMLTQRNVIANAKHMIMALRFTERDAFIHAAPMFHLADAWACWTVTWLGGKHVFLREFNPRTYLELVQRERVTVSLIVPTMINAIVNLPDVEQYDTSSLRLIAFGASPMPVDRLMAAMQVLKCGFSHLYGMTETAPLATQLVPEDMVPDGTEAFARRMLSCGREVAGVEVRIAGEDGTVAAPGEVGEIIMRGPNIMAGYWRQPEVTATALRDGWMHSGDLASMDEHGYVTIVDRSKDMIISGGENVYSTEVEDALYKHAAVLEAAVIGVPDQRWGERVHAVVVLKEGMTATPEQLSDFCRSHIAGYKIPRSVEFMEALPKTGSGKIQKGPLRERHWEGFERRVN